MAQTLTPMEVEELRRKAREGNFTREEARLAVEAIRKSYSAAQASAAVKGTRTKKLGAPKAEDVDFF